VAKLHNRLLDIHPFLDRNGSTCLLFVELLMAAHGGYIPPTDRIKNYNTNLSMILKNSLAVAVVNYEHYKIEHQFGHYKSKSLKMDKETKVQYKSMVADRKLDYEPESRKEQLMKLWRDFKKVYKDMHRKRSSE
jgi:hypothetical protein